jgi:acetylglutamate kinase
MGYKLVDTMDVDAAIERAAILIEALPYLRKFRGGFTVLKIGGGATQHADTLDQLLTDIIFLESVCLHPVIVYGASRSIDRAMLDAGIKPEFRDGLRVTDATTMKIISDVLVDDINNKFLKLFKQQGAKARGLGPLFGAEAVLRGQRVSDEHLGLVGTVTDVDTSAIRDCLSDEMIPIVPAICVEADGTRLNVSADHAAEAVAEALSAEKLMILTDVDGVEERKDGSGTLIRTLRLSEAIDLIDSGILEGGMHRKLCACIAALRSGVRKTHIVNGQTPHSILLEVYTDTGVGTAVIRDQ